MMDSLPAEPQGNTEVGSLSLLQWIFLTQESYQGHLHSRQITNWAIREAMKRQFGVIFYHSS